MTEAEVADVYLGGARLTAADGREYARLLRELDGMDGRAGALSTSTAVSAPLRYMTQAASIAPNNPKSTADSIVPGP